MTGHSIAELVVSPDEVQYSGIERPDAMLILSRDGAGKVGRKLAAMTPDDVVFATPAVADGLKTRAQVRIIDPAQAPVKLAATRVALYCVSRAVKELGILPMEALEAAVNLKPSPRNDEMLETIRFANA